MSRPDLYFAYGSNLLLARIRARVASARFVGRARLPGHRLRFDKRGRDGSGKANVVAEGTAASVFGVLYAIAPEHWADLDRFELGYERVEVEVSSEDEARVGAQTYVCRAAGWRSDDALPLDWYRDLIVRGAREHGLPEKWVAALARHPVRRSR